MGSQFDGNVTLDPKAVKALQRHPQGNLDATFGKVMRAQQQQSSGVHEYA